MKAINDMEQTKKKALENLEPAQLEKLLDIASNAHLIDCIDALKEFGIEVSKPTLCEKPFAPSQMRLFGLAETLGEGGWLKALRLEDYVARRPRRPQALQQALFPYHEAWG